MGQRISVERCYADFGVEPDCTFNSTWSGEHRRGDVPTEPDIAGVGVSKSPDVSHRQLLTSQLLGGV